MGKSRTESRMEKLVKQGKWSQIQKMYPLSDPSTLAELADACAVSKSSEALSVASTLIKNPNEQVKMAAARSLALIGNARTANTLRAILRNTNPESKDLIGQLEESISMLDGGGKKKSKEKEKGKSKK